MGDITQIEFEKLLDKLEIEKSKLHKGEKLSLADFLKRHSYSANLKNLNFAVSEKTVSHFVLKDHEQKFSSDTQVPRRTNLLQDIDFSGCTISNCKFNKCDISGSVFKSLNIASTSFNQTVMNEMSIIDTIFSSNPESGYHCSFEETSLDYSTLKNVGFNQCAIFHSTFNYLEECSEITFDDSSISFSSMVGGAPAKNVTISSSEVDKPALSVVIFSSKNDTFQPQVNTLTTNKEIKYKNVLPQDNVRSVLIPWNNKEPGIFAAITEKMLKTRHLNPVRMDYNVAVNEIALNNEIEQLSRLTTKKMTELKNKVIEKAKKIVSAKNQTEREQLLRTTYEQNKPTYVYHAISSFASHLLSTQFPAPQEALAVFDKIWQKQGISFPMLMMEILREEYEVDVGRFPQMNALYEHAECMFDKVDGVMIPGGQDIDPRFYGAKQAPQTHLPYYPEQHELSDPRRDVLEFSLVYMQQRSGAPKPLAAIGRGSQVVAAAYRGTIHQHLGAEERTNLYLEAITPKSATEETPRLSTKKRMSEMSRQEENDKHFFAAMFKHHQGYDLQSAYGLESTASTITSSNIRIDVIAENLPQNIIISQAHLELAFDEEEHSGATNKLALQLSKRFAESIFGQFDMRVEAYANNKKITPQLLQSTLEKTGRIFLSRSEHMDDLTARKTIPKKTNEYQTIVIGMGPVGLLAALSAVDRGENIMLVTDRDSRNGLTIRQQVLGIDDEAMKFIWSLVRPPLKEKYVSLGIVTAEDYEYPDPMDTSKKKVDTYWYFSTGGLEKLLLEELNARIDERCMTIAQNNNVEIARKEARNKIGIDEILVDKIDPKLLEEIDLSPSLDSAQRLKSLRHQTLLRQHHMDIRHTVKTITLNGIKSINQVPVSSEEKIQTYGYEHIAIANGGKQAAEKSLAGILHGEDVHLDAPLIESHVAVIFHLKGVVSAKPDKKAFTARLLAEQVKETKKGHSIIDPVKMSVLRQYGWTDASRPHQQIYASRTNELNAEFCYIGCEYPNAIKTPAIQAAMELKTKDPKQYQKIPSEIRRVIDKNGTATPNAISKILAREWARLLFRDALPKDICDNNIDDPVYSKQPSPIEKAQMALETSPFDLGFNELSSTILISGDPLLEDISTITPLGDGRMSPLYTTGTGFQTGTKMAKHYHDAQNEYFNRKEQLLMKYQDLQKVASIDDVDQSDANYREEYRELVNNVYQKLHANIRHEIDMIREVQANWIENRNARVLKAKRVLFLMQQALEIGDKVDNVINSFESMRGNKEATNTGFFATKTFLEVLQDPDLAKKIDKIKSRMDTVAKELHQAYGRFTEDQIIAYEKLPSEATGNLNASVQEYYQYLRKACLSIHDLHAEIESCATFCDTQREKLNMTSSVFGKLQSAITEMQDLLSCEEFKTHITENELNIDASDPFVKDKIKAMNQEMKVNM